MNKNTIQLAKKSTVLVLGLFIQINFAHSKILPTTTDFSSTCTGDNLMIKGNLNTCQTSYIPAEIGDTVTVIVKTTLPNTKLVINATPTFSGVDNIIVLTTTQYSKPGVYKLTFPVKNYIPNKSHYTFYARGAAINNQSITTETPPISVTISNITGINAQKKNPFMPF